MNKVWLVAKWEFFRFFKPKQEIISYFVMLGIFAAVTMVQYWQQTSTQKTAHIGSVGVTSAELGDSFKLTELPQETTPQQAQSLQLEQGLDGVLFIRDQQGKKTFELFVNQQSGWQDELRDKLLEYYKQQALMDANLSAEQLDSINQPIDFKLMNQAQENIGSDVRILSFLVVTLATVAVFSSFGLSIASITSEKMQRVTEQLLTCVNYQQWIDGKTLGICMASVKSMFTTCLSFALIFAVIAVVNGEKMSFSLGIQWGVVGQILVFTILGIVFWNYVFTGFAATIDDPNHSGKTGVMLLPIVPIMLVFAVMNDPNGQVAKLLSIFPLTSISFMPMRLASMDVPLYQYILSVLFLLGGIIMVRMFATRIFRANIALYGKEPGWADIWRSMLK